MKSFLEENWPPIIGAILVSVVIILCIFTVRKQFQHLDIQRDACAPFALIGLVSYKGKDLVVCDSVDGPIVMEIK
jgi:hypothetical protein